MIRSVRPYEKSNKRMKILAVVLSIFFLATHTLAQDDVAAKLIRKLEDENARLTEENSSYSNSLQLKTKTIKLRDEVDALNARLETPKSKTRQQDEKLNLLQLGTKMGRNSVQQRRSIQM